MNIVILGPPGAGKGTICNKIINEFKYKLICTGDLLRLEKSSGSELGNKIASIIDNGNLVPDNLITKIITNELRNPVRPNTFFLIDGYPRTIQQALDLDGMLNIKKVIWLNINESTTISRNIKRGESSGRLDDVNIDIIKHRLKLYNDLSLPLKNFYKNRLIEIDGEGTPDEVYHELIKNIIYK